MADGPQRRIVFNELKRYLDWIRNETAPEKDDSKTVATKDVDDFYQAHTFVMTLISSVKAEQPKSKFITVSKKD
jgi:hypothetical protein